MVMISVIKTIQHIGKISQSKNLLINVQRKIHTPSMKEVIIPTEWGHIAGKWWGDVNTQPILAMHGWQDNAGTWDTLVPLLPPQYSLLAIDLPGHGNSSWIPKGLLYSHWHNVQCIQVIKEYFKWDKVSLLGHSMGSINAFRYASTFNDEVNFYIAFENIVPDIVGTLENIHKRLSTNLKKSLIDQTRLAMEPPSYGYEEAIIRWHLGTRKSVSLEAAHHLVDRGTKKSKADQTKYYFSRDARLKNSALTPESAEFVKYQILQIKCPVLHIKGIDSKYATDDLAISSHELLAQNNDRYELHNVPGTHHVHLNTPELVAPIVIQFLKKYGTVNRQVQKAVL